MAGNFSVQEVEALIDGDIHSCEKLIELLTDEAEALKSRDSQALEKIIEAKASYIGKLEESAKTRSQWARSPDINEKDNWNALLEDFNKPSLKRAWEKLKHLLDECKSKNEINGKMLSKNQQVFSRLINLVRGQTASPPLYNACGESSGGNVSRKMGEV